MVASGKRKRPEATSMRPLTAFFERKRAATLPQDAQLDSRDEDASNAVGLVEEIDSEDEEITVHASIDEDDSHAAMTTAFKPPPHEPQALNTAHLTRIVHRRELGSRARGVPSSSVRRRRQQTDQRLMRWALTQFHRLPLELALPDDAMRVVQAHRLASHCDEFFTSCLSFDSQGALLVAGSSNGVVALFDCDEMFHRTINLQQSVLLEESAPETPTLHPIHMIFTGNEVQRIRWNPANEDEIACCFLNRNEIFLYNLQKFPSKPYQVLKTSSRPSSGYTDMVFLPSSPPAAALNPAKATTKKIRTGSIVASDVDGMVRAWDLRFPTKPQWAVSTGSQPVTSLLLDHDKRLLLCGTEGGIVMSYDVQELVVPAFGSKPMPQRRASLRIVDLLLPVLSSEAAAFLRYSLRESSSVLAVTSMHLVPTSKSQIILQLRNQWLVILDVSTSQVLKVHTPIKELPPSLRPATQPLLPATVLHSGGDSLTSHQRGPTHRQQRHSWLHLHRCSTALAFHGDMVCAGLPDEDALSIVDLHRMDLLRAKRASSESAENVSSWPLRAHDKVERLSRFCIDTPDLVTAVAVHPMQHWILCGGANLRIRVLGVAGTRGVDEVHDQREQVEVVAVNDDE